jgi:tetratricopeptide (TPR) repeat protein
MANEKKGGLGGSGDDSFESELDDWASAIDEWDSNLALPDVPAVPEKPKAAAKPATETAAKATPAPKPPSPSEPTHTDDEPAPLDAAPAQHASPSDDPLMQLFDGDMELPEEAGEALGDLLGDRPPAPIETPAAVPADASVPIAIEAPAEEVEIDAAFSDFANDESTRVAPADEVSALLDNIDALDNELTGEHQAHPDLLAASPPPAAAKPVPAPAPAPPVPVPPLMPATPPPPGTGSAASGVPASTRAVLGMLKARKQAKEAPPATAKATPAARANEDFGDESTRVAPAAELDSLLDLPVLDDPVEGGVTVRDSESVDVDLDVEMEIGEAEPPASTDDDFYDDISIEAGKEETSKPRKEPERPAFDDEPPTERVELDAIIPRDRSSDPDLTPLPVADDLFDTGPSAVQVPLGRLDSRQVAVARASLPGAQALELQLPERVEPRPLEVSYLRDQLALTDTERLLCQDTVRSAQLACLAARLCEKLDDPAGALERYQAALEQDAGSATALRGLRRVRLASDAPPVDQVVAMLDREIEAAALGEKRGLMALKAELHLSRGDRDLANEAYLDVLEMRPDDLGAALALCDVTAGQGNDDELQVALARLADALTGSGASRLRAQVAIERGRLSENSGRVRDAVARYRDALGLDPLAAGALWGLMRVAVRTPGETDDIDTHARLVDLLPRGGLRAAFERRLGLLRAQAGDSATARPALQAGADGGDLLSLRALAELERAEGRLDEAAQAMLRAADLERDAGRRADLLITAGELCEARGNTGQAAAAYVRAMSEYPDDPRAAYALERTQVAEGDKESALTRHLRAAERDPARGPLEWTRAARLLEELGRRDEALARLSEALQRAPGYPPAVQLAVELHLHSGRPSDAAIVLTAAADEAEIPESGEAMRERAARLWQRAGHADEALRTLAPLLSAGDARSPRWLEERLLSGSPAELADSLRREAEAAELNDKPRAAGLWHRRGLLLAALDPEGSAEAQKRTLSLEPAHGPAAVELMALALRSAALAEVAPVLEARQPSMTGRAEDVVTQLRRGVALEEAGDLPAARAAYAQAAKDNPSGGEALDRTARHSGDDALIIESLERELAAETSPEVRFALLCTIAERQEKRGQHDRAAERYRQAIEIKPMQPGALAGLDRAYRAAKNYSALADRALSDLKDAEDVRRKVAAYERLAFVDGELRGDRESAHLAFESIIEIDHAHHTAMRVIERQSLKEGRYPELLALYEQMGLTATDPSFAVAVHLDRARLRRRVASTEVPPAELEAAVDNDHRLALFKDDHSRPALRHLLARARHASDQTQEAELSARLADAAADDVRTVAICLTRAGQALWRMGKTEEARARFEAAVQRGGLHVPALAELLDLALSVEDYGTAVVTAEQAGQAAADVDSRASAYLLAATIAEEKLSDLERALMNLKLSLEIEPRGREAFERLRGVLTKLRDFASLAELYRRRLEVETDGIRLQSLHIDLARVQRDHLNDRGGARAELKAVLRDDANHAEALAMLGQLLYEDGAWAEAAETLIKRARIEKTRNELKDIFFKLGLIYAQHTPDAKRAIACFTRVAKADPTDMVALEHLSNLYLKEWDWKGALEATRRLADLEKDKVKKIAHLHRVAKIHEEGFKDARHALEALRAALDIDSMHLPSIGELAKFFDRQSDVQSMRVHLDRTVARVRQQLETNPYDQDAYHALFRIFGWRRAPDRALLAAGVLDHMGAADGDERAHMAKAAGRDPYPGSALADAALDEVLFDARVPAGFRHLFRLLDEPLSKLFRADLRRLGIGKNEKLPRTGHALREVANRMAADLSLPDFDLYVTAAHPTALMIELTEPLSVVVGAKLVEGAHEHEVRFLFGRVLKMMQCHMALPMRLSADDLGVLVGAIVRQFVPEFVPAGFDEKLVVAEAGRMSKLIPKKIQGDLFPFAMECASPQLDLRRIAPALVDAANRAGLLACGTMGHSLAAIKRLGDENQVRGLLRFAMSEEIAELRRLAGTSIG